MTNIMILIYSIYYMCTIYTYKEISRLYNTDYKQSLLVFMVFKKQNIFRKCYHRVYTMTVDMNHIPKHRYYTLYTIYIYHYN